MSYNGSGTFQINTSGQPVVAGTVISSTAFNALTADLATGLSTAITKDGQTATTVRIPFAAGISSTLVTDSSSVSTGSIITAGGVGIAKALYVGTTANIAGTTNLAGLTASSAVATDASKNLVSVTNTGTGNNVLATAPTIASANLTTALTLTGAAGTTGQALTSQGTGVAPIWSTVSSDTVGFKNRIINGAMVIDQRNAGASVNAPTTTGYTLDRWYVNASQSSKLTIQQNAGPVTPPAGFTYYLGATSSSAYSITASDLFYVSQFIEGYNSADLAWGTASASSVTLSFRVYSSLTGTFGGALQNSANARSYPFTYSIPTANTWTTISVTVAGDTSGTWLTTNGIGIRVFLGLGVGSTYSGTAGAWAAADYRSATGATSVVGTNGATFYITGVQLEKGSTATSFDYRSIGTELALCQRYFWRNKSGGSGASVGVGYLATATIFRGYAQFPVTMRAAPTFTINTDSGNLIINTATGNIAITTTGGTFSTDSGTISLDMGSSGTAGQGAVIYAGSGSANAAYLQFSSEL